MLYYAEASDEEVDGGIQITGSHNPGNYNGFKMVFQGRPFFGADIQTLGQDGRRRCLRLRQRAKVHHDADILDAYVGRLLEGYAGIDPASSKGCGSAGTPAMAPPARARQAGAAAARRTSSAVYRRGR
jgi:phosphomannomutase